VTELRVHIPDDLARALDAHVSATAATTDAVVRAALESFLTDAGHTAFQVSTTGALVEGVYAGAAEVGHLRAHGDLGLGTFAGLDGELVVVDGRFLHVRSDGSVQDAPDSARTPFAMVTRFAPDTRAEVPGGADLAVELPETASFLAADLRADPAAALDRAEHGRPSPGRGAPPDPFS
jgi:acetolactate decarboxylase